ncbi:MAG: hypothetical protein M3R02_24625 [Chloroflexota bacterium]|nr:hypothetical protein [Chloroflexota bacterium]
MKPEFLIRPLIVAAAFLAALGVGATASAHPHQVTTGDGEVVVIANGQNHPGFVFNPATGQYESCEGVSEPPNSGPAGYGLETAHHGPDQGTPGTADDCFALDGAPAANDNNPAID